MQNLLTLGEILVTVVVPLLLLYLRGTWKQRTMLICVSIIPVLWYFVYAPIHEISHLLGGYLVGARILEVKLIPSFWLGEIAVAWIRSEGFTSPWTELVMTSGPYVLDIVSIVIGICVLQRKLSRNGFLVGFLFMVLCLRPAFDLVCETIGFFTGFRGDLYHIALTIGESATWAILALSMIVAVYAIIIVLRRFKGFPQDEVIAAS